MHPQIDHKIISEWKSRIDEFRVRKTRMGAYALAVLIVSVGLFASFRHPLLLLPVPFCFIYMLLDWLIVRTSPLLRCPHCGLSPVGTSTRSSPLDADYCANCHHWLVNPSGPR